jgi:hypothetical protein
LPSRRLPLVRLATLQSVVCGEVSGPLGCPIPPWRRRFRPACAVFLAPPSPDIVRRRVHPLVRLASSSECLEPSSDPCLPAPIAFHEVSFPIATSTDRVHVREPAPKLASFRPRRFARPRRFTPQSVLRVCFTPLPRPGFALQGLSLSHRRTSSSLAVTLTPLRSVACRRLPDDASTTTPDHRALVNARIRCAPRRVSSRPARSPRELHLLRVLLRAPRRRPLRPLPRPRPFEALDVLTVRDLIDPFGSTSPVQGL